ncbi:PhoH family protein [Vibrio sp. PNB22_3_1]
MSKLFILDTCVLLSDPYSIYKMGGHDVGIAPEVLNELDRIKDSAKDASFEARQVIRSLYDLIGDKSIDEMRSGVSLGEHLGRLCVLTYESNSTGDNAIISAVLDAQEKSGDRIVVLVTRDMNMNLRAKMAGVTHVEDYRSDDVSREEALDDDGFVHLKNDFWDYVESVTNDSNVFHCKLIQSAPESAFLLNRFIESEGHLYRILSRDGLNLVIKQVLAQSAFGVEPRNDRQSCAIDVLMDDNISLVTLTGGAGSGKTLIGMCCSIALALERNGKENDEKRYNRIIIVRNNPPIAEQSGYLPGDEKTKAMSFLQGPVDALEYLAGGNNPYQGFDYLCDAANIEWRSINTLRGASPHSSILFIEEAQNLTRNALKALITRAGPGTKVVITGNISASQIDSAYLTPQSTGLLKAVEVFAGHPNAAHIQLRGGQRESIATYAEEAM